MSERQYIKSYQRAPGSVYSTLKSIYENMPIYRKRVHIGPRDQRRLDDLATRSVPKIPIFAFQTEPVRLFLEFNLAGEPENPKPWAIGLTWKTMERGDETGWEKSMSEDENEEGETGTVLPKQPDTATEPEHTEETIAVPDTTKTDVPKSGTLVDPVVPKSGTLVDPVVSKSDIPIGSDMSKPGPHKVPAVPDTFVIESTKTEPDVTQKTEKTGFTTIHGIIVAGAGSAIFLAIVILLVCLRKKKNQDVKEQ